MAGDAEQLAIDLEARVTKLEAGMGKAQAIANKAYAGMKRSSGSATKQMEQDMIRSTSRINQALAATSTKIGAYGKAFAGGLVGGIVAGGVAGIVSKIGDVAHSVAQVGDEAKRAGLSAEAFQELAYVAKANRIEVDALTDGMKELALRADEYIATGKGSAAESFKRLGISAEELKVKLQDPSALFTEIIGKLSKLDKAAQIRISDELFGGTGGEKFVQLIAQGEEGIRATIREAHNLGAVMSDEVIERAAELDRKFNAVSTTVGTALKTAIVEAASELQKFIDMFRAFDERATGTLKNRFGELQTRYGQLVKQQGTTEDKLLSYIGKDAATEIEAVKAEMDQVAAELRKRATPMLREKLVAQNTASTPYTPPPSTGGSRSKAISETEKQAQATRKLIAELQEELSLVGSSNTEKEIANTLRRANVDATSAEGRQIAELITQINAETDALQKQKEAQEARTQALSNMFEMGADALGDIVDGSVKAEDAIKKLAVQLALAAAQSALLGTGPLAGLFGGAGGLFGMQMFPGGMGFAAPGYIGTYADGTANTGGQRGEPRGIVHGQEAVIPLPNGGQVPVHLTGGANAGGGAMDVDVRVYVDQDGNWKAAVQRISQREAAAATRQGIDNFNRGLPDRMQQIQADPRGRGR